MGQVDWDRFSDGWATGSMRCLKCGNIFTDVRVRYSDHDKVEGEWPRCCNELTGFLPDWRPEVELKPEEMKVDSSTNEEEPSLIKRWREHIRDVFNRRSRSDVYVSPETLHTCHGCGSGPARLDGGLCERCQQGYEQLTQPAAHYFERHHCVYCGIGMAYQKKPGEPCPKRSATIALPQT